MEIEVTVSDLGMVDFKSTSNNGHTVFSCVGFLMPDKWLDSFGDALHHLFRILNYVF